ncbi:MAG TPA: O-antigen ligase family protein [Solirubrobacterales bacterium]|nr:O-antigen ligase family protein [Solirubrobacterales bacterium]
MSAVLAAAGVLVAAGAAAAAILLPAGRPRSAAMLLALVLFPALILGDQWHSAQIVDLRDNSTRLTMLALAGLAAVAILTAAFHRWPTLLPLAIVAVLPFRVPLHAGGDTANLLVPLYLVIAGGVLSSVLSGWREGGRVPLRKPALGRPFGSLSGSAHKFPPGDPPALAPAPSPRSGRSQFLPCVLAGVVVLYALQTLYSPDFSKSLQNVCFFFVPFSLMYALLRDVEWDRKLLVRVLWVVAVEAVAFVLVGSVEYLSRDLFWNDQVIRSNEFHTYFRVNSIFWDPNIYGRYLALVIVVAMSALLWAKERKTLALLSALVAVLWLGLVPTFSQSSFAALLAGLAVLAALRWSLRWTLGAVGVVALLALLVVVFAGGTSKISISRLNVDTGGRANLVSGGTDLFAQRPIWGYGAGSFPRAYREHAATKKVPVSVSHTEPVTVAAEQGVIGLAAYAALLLAALWTMCSGLSARRKGRGSPRRKLWSTSRQEPNRPPQCGFPEGGPPALPPLPRFVARVAVLAAFVALLVHTMAYAGFYEDPITWVLLAAGASLASVPVRAET